jgi:flagellar protein FlaJ
MAKQKKIKKQDPPFGEKFIEKYKTFAFKLFGKRIKEEKYEKLSEQIHMSNMKYTPAVILSVMILTGIIAFFISFLFYYFVFAFIIKSELSSLYIISLTSLNAVVGFVFLPLLMQMKISTKRLQIDRELPFILSELSVLASTGLTPIKIVRHMAEHSGSEIMKIEFRRIVHKIDIEGKDIVTAISITAKETPSVNYRETLWDLSNMIHQGGDLDEYLREKADHTMMLRRAIQKEFTDKLAMYSEMYLSLVLVGVLFIAMAAFLMDAMGSTLSGLDADSLLMLLAYGIVPVACIVTIVITSSAYSRKG